MTNSFSTSFLDFPKKNVQFVKYYIHYHDLSIIKKKLYL